MTTSSAAAGIALLLMDYQEGIVRRDGVIGQAGPGPQAEERGVLAAAAEVLARFREQGLPRLHVRVAFDEDYHRMTSASPRFQFFRTKRLMLDGSPEAQICGELQPQPDEPVVSKGCVVPFIGTNLTELLRARGATHLVLGGVATNQVVEGTARMAADAGYQVTVLEDLCAGATAEMHTFSVEKMLPNFGRVTTSSTLLQELAVD